MKAFYAPPRVMPETIGRHLSDITITYGWTALYQKDWAKGECYVKLQTYFLSSINVENGDQGGSC